MAINSLMTSADLLNILGIDLRNTGLDVTRLEMLPLKQNEVVRFVFHGLVRMPEKSPETAHFIADNTSDPAADAASYTGRSLDES